MSALPEAVSGPDPEGAGGKEALRRHFRRHRRESLPAAAAGILAVAARELAPRRAPSLASGKRLGLWWPLPGEPDLLPLAEMLPHRLALPAVLPTCRLAYLPWSPGEPLEPDGCGIAAPRLGGTGAHSPLEPAELGLLLVPALAMDRSGWRLGTGGGWYDRLRSDPRWRAVPALGVLPAACVTAELPRDPWDVPFDGWIDEGGLHRVTNVASS